MRRILTITALLAWSSIASSASETGGEAAGDWPQWRGPRRDGVSSEADWAPAGKAESLWKKDVGLGYSTVSIQDGRLFTMGYDEERGVDVVWCLDPETGAEIWKHEYPAERWNKMHNGGTQTTPSADGDLVYTVNREGTSFCLEASGGKVRWQRDLRKEYDLTYPTWGFAASPLVLEDALILNLGKVIALDKETGKQIWVTAKSYGSAYSTPSDLVLADKPCLAVFDSLGLVILERSSGKELMLHAWATQYDVNAATPVPVGERVLISSGYKRGAALIDVSGEKPEVVWENKTMNNKMSGCILIGEHFYGFDESLLKCMDTQGEEKWRVRGMGNGALVGAADRLIVMSSDGELVVAQADPTEFKELSRAKVLDGGVYWTTPVISGGRIYCRNSLGNLVCRDHRIAR